MFDPAQAWRPTRRLTLRATWSLWLLCLVATPVALVLQLLTADGGTASALRPAAPVTFLWLLVAWVPGERRHWPRTAMTALTWAMATVAQYATYLTVGETVLAAARLSLAVTVQAVVALAWHRWRTGDDNLTPHRPRDVGSLVQGALLGALVTLPLVPGRADGGGWVEPSLGVAWWVVLSAGWLFAGAACLLLLVTRRPRTEAVPTRLGDAYGLLLLTAGCLGLVMVFPDAPLSWTVMGCAVWAGLTLGPWTSAAFVLTCDLAMVVAQALPSVVGDGLQRDEVVTVLALDALMGAFSLTVLLLSLLRDQRAYSAAEVTRHRQEALDQAGLLGTVFESINEALVLVDADGAVQLHNAAAVRVLGRERLVTEPRKWLRRMGESSVFTYPLVPEEPRGPGGPERSEEAARILAVQLAQVPYAGASSVVAIVRDITTERARIEELASFAAVAAHDLKGPLAAVRGWIEVALDEVDEDPASSRSALDRGLRATERMSREIDDWLTYNVVREGSVQPEAVALQPVVEAVAATHPGADITVDTPDTVQADPTLLQHLLTNLVGNAVKYSPPTEPARVVVRSRTEPGRRGEPGWVHLEVVDAGIGIPAGEERAVFEPFRRASTVQETHEGSGLGLALCKRIVRRHGGTIRATRNQGPGTTVAVTLPAAGSSGGAGPLGPREQLPSPRPPSP